MPDIKGRLAQLQAEIGILRKQLGEIEEAEGSQSMRAWHVREKLIALEQKHNDTKERK